MEADKMGKVFNCNATSCSYNKNKECHTPKLIIDGGEPDPICQSFSKEKIELHKEIVGKVFSCQAKDCLFNEEMKCTSDAIFMKKLGTSVVCDNYSGKKIK